MGKICPVPVIMTKKAIKENPDNEDILVKVDNEIATQNLAKMAEQLGIKIKTEKIASSNYTVLFCISGNSRNLNLKKEEPCDCKLSNNSAKDYAVILGSDEMGSGDKEFGKKLLEGFIYSLTEQDVLPKILICYNSAVNLTTVNQKTIEDLKTLEENGCEILSCGLCLDFYGLTEKLQVGKITNMYRIAEIMRTEFIVRP